MLGVGLNFLEGKLMVFGKLGLFKNWFQINVFKPGVKTRADFAAAHIRLLQLAGFGLRQVVSRVGAGKTRNKGADQFRGGHELNGFWKVFLEGFQRSLRAGGSLGLLNVVRLTNLLEVLNVREHTVKSRLKFG